MWERLSSFIIRYRRVNLLVILLLTAFMGWKATHVRMSYKMAGLLPKTDSTYIDYQNFIETFSEDGNIILLGVEDPAMWELENFNTWYRLGKDLKGITVNLDTIIEGKNLKLEVNAVDSVFSGAHTYNLVKNEAEKKFDFIPLVQRTPRSQAEVDSIKNQLYSLPFYENILYDKATDAMVMMVFVNAEIFNSGKRGTSIDEIYALVDNFGKDTGVKTHLSGLPFIRTSMAAKVKAELRFFVLLAALVTAILLFLFFKNIRVVVVCMFVVGVGVLWALGTIALFDFPITMLMGLIPPLMIVIGVPNCIYLLNKYHAEYKKHGNKVKALSRVINKVGNATFLTNTTTALGFATFVFTSSEILQQFGIIAFICILGVFFLSIFIVPIVFSYLDPPKRKHVRHLDRKWVYKLVGQLLHIVQNHRKWVYVTTVFVLGLGAYGLSKIQTTGNMVDDLPSDDKVILDLRFFENHFNGVMPFEVLVDFKKKFKLSNAKDLRRIDRLQKVLSQYDQLSRSISVVDATKFVRQAFYNGLPERYGLIKTGLGGEQAAIGKYFNKDDYQTGGIEQSFLDSSGTKTRITAQVADMGTIEMRDLLAELEPRIDSIFPPADYDITITGTSITYLQGTTYMVKNLFVSLMIAICIIAFIMAILFRSFRMVLISLLPNLIPLIFTGAVMGYFGIPIKPSTILVFSVAFGISVDDTIHFLAKYRQELRMRNWNIKVSVLEAVKETGVSMMYTSVVLFFGFGIFGLSEFEGTRALGILVSMTLLVAMLTNLVLLPSLLLSLDKHLTTKTFKEPLLVIIDEEDDIDTAELEVRKGFMNIE